MKSLNLLPVFIIIILFSGCRSGINQTGKGPSPITVVIKPVAKINTGKDITLSGNIEGDKTVRLGFLVAGRINFIATEEGGRVFREKLLASIDPASYTIARDLAAIQVSQVQDEYDRLKAMHDNNSLSESDFTKISYGLQQARTELRLHEKNLSDTKLLSPIDGVLLKKLAEVGEITGVGIPVFVVSDIRKIKVNAYIPENELHNVKIGQVARINIASVGKVYDGKITEVGSAAEPSSRSFLLKIEMENPGLLARPGMIAEVTIPSVETKEIIAVPVEAISHDFNDQSYVFVADTVKHKAFKRFIIPGNLLNDKIEIISGLRDGEPLVTGGMQKLVDGSDIAINK